MDVLEAIEANAIIAQLDDFEGAEWTFCAAFATSALLAARRFGRWLFCRRLLWRRLGVTTLTFGRLATRCRSCCELVGAK